MFEQQGRPEEALPHAQQALTLSRAADWRPGPSQGAQHHRLVPCLLGDPRHALTDCRESLALKREIGHRYRQATTLSHLGDTHHATGDLDAARDAWQEALDILDHLGVALGAGLSAGYPDPDELRVKLRHLDRTG